MPVKSFEVKLLLNISHWICCNEVWSGGRRTLPQLLIDLISTQRKWIDKSHKSQWHCQEVGVMFQWGSMMYMRNPKMKSSCTMQLIGFKPAYPQCDQPLKQAAIGLYIMHGEIQLQCLKVQIQDQWKYWKLLQRWKVSTYLFWQLSSMQKTTTNKQKTQFPSVFCRFSFNFSVCKAQMFWET